MIMLVEDDVGMREVCSLFLESQGFEVDMAANGAEALRKMKLCPHALVISDCAMPEMSGLQLSQNLRADPATAQIPILLMSASRLADIAEGASYDTFLRKPFGASTLLAAVKKLLAAPARPSPGRAAPA